MVATARASNGKFTRNGDTGIIGDESDTNDHDGNDEGIEHGGTILDPAVIDGNLGTEHPPTGKAKRGRPKGTKPRATPSGKETKNAKLGVGALDSLILFVHGIGATVLKLPELELSKEEAKHLADASANVLRHYDLRTTQKTMDYVMLGIAVAGIYGPRIMIIAQKNKRGEPEKLDPVMPINTSGIVM